MEFSLKNIDSTNASAITPVLPASMTHLPGSDSIWACGMFLKQKPVCVVLGERKQGVLVIFHIYISPASEEDKKKLLHSMLTYMEEQAERKKVKALLSYQPEEGLMDTVTEQKRWDNTYSQKQYIIEMKSIRRTQPPVMHDFTIQPCRTIDRPIFHQAMEKIYHSTETRADALPPIAALHQDSSYFLAKGNQIIGWLLAIADRDAQTIKVSRFHVLPAYRHLSISHWCFSYALVDMQITQGIRNIKLNVESSNPRLMNVVEKGFLGKVLDQVKMNRAMKELKS